VKSLLANVSQSIDRLPPSNPAVVEYQYRRLQLAQKTGDASALSAAGEWIVQYGEGTAYELPALVVMAREADKAVDLTASKANTSTIAEASKLYARLVRLLGETPATLSSNKNAFAAATGLAQYDEALERWPQAAERLNRLVEAQPNDRRLLRRAGLASFHAGHHAEALERWRTLLTGLDSGSDDWLEAKYFQIACLKEIDQVAAQKVFEQFRVLFPDVKSSKWQPQFAELERQVR
jgi:tetratricopeptide (TPR) repeat protein